MNPNHREQVCSLSPDAGWEGLAGGAGKHLPKTSPVLPSKDPSSPSLVLIGTVHGDPLGYARALKLLRRLQPDLVTVEISRFSLRYRERQESRWQRLLAQALEELPAGAAGHLAIRRLAAQVALPFEVRAARHYGRRFAIPWRPLDLGGLSRRHLPRYARELLTPENVRALLTTEDEPLADYVAREYGRARLAVQRPPWWSLRRDPESRRRERLQARRLRDCLARYPRVVHLGGWEHLVPAPLSVSTPRRQGAGLCQELAELRPLRLFLDEADLPAGDWYWAS
jgi:hypothetical protein